MEEKVEVIIQRMLAKDFVGLECLIECFSFTILSAIHQILYRPEDQASIDDVANQTFYKIWKNIQQYDSEKGAFTTWISTIAKRTALDYKRKEMKHQALLPLEAIQTELLVDAQVPFEQETFLTFIAQLKEEDQQIFLSRYYYNEEPKQIATRLNLSTEVIYNRLSRGKKKLRTQLKEGGFEK
ncbi:sigma-70 family RNA polymerase sigma factor [Enterococcus sp. LJL98]